MKPRTQRDLWLDAGGNTPAYSQERYKELCLLHGHLIERPKVAAWWSGTALAFDLETTSANPLEARIVSAHCSEVTPTGSVVKCAKLVNPGIPIPAEASAIHGITDDIAATGFHPKEALHWIAYALAEAWRSGLAVVIMNAAYDLTVMACELERVKQPPLEIGPVLDPFVIDRGVYKYRKGKRNLAALAEHYGVKQDGAHSSAGDALCAARIVWAQARRCLMDLTLEQMQPWQQAAHLERQSDFREYLIREGKADEAATVTTEWPILRR